MNALHYLQRPIDALSLAVCVYAHLFASLPSNFFSYFFLWFFNFSFSHFEAGQTI